MNCFSPTELSGPDGLEAWTVALAACIINFVMAGLARMSGILYVAFIDIFQVDRKQASLPFSVRSSMRNLFGPVVGILGQKYGARPVALIGAITGAVSAGICFYAQDIIWITVLWGGICGVSAALATTLNQAVIGQHFKKYRTTAAGMAFSGGCVGSFVFPVLLEYLLNTFGVQGTFLIMSGILMHVIPATLLLRKPTWLKKQNSEVQITTMSDKVRKTIMKQETVKIKTFHEGTYKSDIKESVKNEKDCSVELDSIKTSVSTVYSQQCNYIPKIDKKSLWDNRHFIINLLTKTSHEYSSSFNVFQKVIGTEYNEIKEIEQLFSRMFYDVLNDKNVTKHSSDDANLDVFKKYFLDVSDNIHDTGNNQTNNDLQLKISNLSSVNGSYLLNFLSLTLKILCEEDTKNIVNTVPEVDKEIFAQVLDELQKLHVLLSKYMERNAENNAKPSNSFSSHIKTGCNLYTKPIFLLICLCRTVHMLITMPLFTTLVDFSMDKGLPKEDGKYVIAALSLGDLLGRLCLGWISDRGYVTLPRFMMIGMIFQGAFLASLSVMYSRITLLSGIAACGLLQGCLFVRHPVLMNRYLASNEQSIGMGCLNFFSGLLSFIMPVYIGYFRDVIGSYDEILYINGAIAALTGLLWCFERHIVDISIYGKGNIKVRL